MPSGSPDADGRVSRRRVLASFGTGIATAFAGCSGQLPGTDPVRLDAETIVERGEHPRIRWQYPSGESDTESIGYAMAEADQVIRRTDRPSAIRLNFNSTGGQNGRSGQEKEYRLDWFRFRVWPPAAYEGRINHDVRVEPPGQWEDFSTHYDIQDTVRRTTVELRNIDTRGTITIPAVFDPGASRLPDRLHCSFTVQASRPGALGKSIRVGGQGLLSFEEQ